MSALKRALPCSDTEDTVEVPVPLYDGLLAVPGEIVVGMGDLGAVRAPGRLVTHALGSCVGVVLHDALTGTAGLLHCMLPHSSVDPARALRQPMAFCDLGLVEAVQRVRAEGADPRRLTARLVGGAAIPGAPAMYRIGDRNVRAAREGLTALRVPVIAEETGGTISRTVRIDAATGRVTITTPGLAERWL